MEDLKNKIKKSKEHIWEIYGIFDQSSEQDDATMKIFDREMDTNVKLGMILLNNKLTTDAKVLRSIQVKLITEILDTELEVLNKYSKLEERVDDITKPESIGITIAKGLGAILGILILFISFVWGLFMYDENKAMKVMRSVTDVGKAYIKGDE